jgi:hypothetical protein
LGPKHLGDGVETLRFAKNASLRVTFHDFKKVLLALSELVWKFPDFGGVAVGVVNLV